MCLDLRLNPARSPVHGPIVVIEQSRIEAIWATLSNKKSTAADFARAEAEAERLVREAPGRADVAVLFGVVLAAVEKFEAAIPWLMGAPREARSSLTFAGALALSLLRTNRLAEAQQVFQQAPASWVSADGTAIPSAAWYLIGFYGEWALRTGAFDLAEIIFPKLFDSIHAEQRRLHRIEPTASAKVVTPPPDRKILPLLYAPIEIKSREFDSRLLIAIHAAAQGLTTIVGATWNIRALAFGDLPPGIVLAKTFSKLDMIASRKAAAAGHFVVGIDEEALGRSDRVGLTSFLVHPAAVASVDIVLLQGEAQQRLWKKLFPFAADRMVVTGNPRTDLIHLARLEDPATTSADRGRDNILICLMNGGVNGKNIPFPAFISEAFKNAAPNFATPAGDDAASAIRENILFHIQNMRQMRDVIRAVAHDFADRTIIVRPHPVESPTIWRDIAAEFANIRVTNEGQVNEWIGRAAAVVFQSGCATGVEAVLAGVPAVRFDGNDTVSEPNIGFSSRLGLPARSPSDVVAHIRHALSGQSVIDGSEGIIDSFLSNATTGNVSRIIADTIASLWRRHAGPGQIERGTIANFNARRPKPFVPNTFHLGKFPATSESGVAARVTQLCQRLGIANIPGVTQVEWNTFMIAPSNRSELQHEKVG